MKTTWNTGRLYTRAGQRIAASYDVESGRVYFADADRMVDGTYTTSISPLIQTTRELQADVMQHYDVEGYESMWGDYRAYQREVQALYRLALKDAPCL